MYLVIISNRKIFILSRLRILYGYGYSLFNLIWPPLWAHFFTADLPFLPRLHSSPSVTQAIVPHVVHYFLTMAVELPIWRACSRTVHSEIVCEGVRSHSEWSSVEVAEPCNFGLVCYVEDRGNLRTKSTSRFSAQLRCWMRFKIISEIILKNTLI